jgi:hypothetical protein
VQGHQLERLVEALVGLDRDRVGGGDLPDPDRAGVDALCDRPDDDVAVGQDRDEALAATTGSEPTSSSFIVRAASETQSVGAALRTFVDIASRTVFAMVASLIGYEERVPAPRSA